MKPTVAIIGYGRIGRLIAHHLRRHADVVVYDVRRGVTSVKGARSAPRSVSLPVALASSYIILAIPAGRLESFLKKNGKKVKPGSTVADVCAVKIAPVRWMKTYLPPGVSIFGTHPLFGPSSASTSLKGRTIVVCPARVSPAKLSGFRRLLRRAGLFVREMSPRDHDRWIAQTLLVTQVLGSALKNVASRQPLPTKAYRNLEQIIEIAAGDSSTLLADIRTYNPYAKKSIARLHRALRNYSKPAYPLLKYSSTP